MPVVFDSEERRFLNNWSSETEVVLSVAFSWRTTSEMLPSSKSVWKTQTRNNELVKEKRSQIRKDLISTVCIQEKYKGRIRSCFIRWTKQDETSCWDPPTPRQNVSCHSMLSSMDLLTFSTMNKSPNLWAIEGKTAVLLRNSSVQYCCHPKTETSSVSCQILRCATRTAVS